MTHCPKRIAIIRCPHVPEWPDYVRVRYGLQQWTRTSSLRSSHFTATCQRPLSAIVFPFILLLPAGPCYGPTYVLDRATGFCVVSSINIDIEDISQHEQADGQPYLSS